MNSQTSKGIHGKSWTLLLDESNTINQSCTVNINSPEMDEYEKPKAQKELHITSNTAA